MNHVFTTKGGKFIPLVQVREKAQITIPSKIRKVLGIKDELLKELEDLKNLPHPNESKIKAFGTKLGKKLQEISENMFSKIIIGFLKSQMS